MARVRPPRRQFRNDILAGPRWEAILLLDPSGNVIELFQPRSARRHIS